MLLVLIMILSTACSSKETSNESDSDSGTVKISMTLGQGPKTPNSWAQQQLESIMSEKTGKKIKLDPIFLPTTDQNSKVNLLMSAKDTMPDILWWNSSMQPEFNDWTKAGVLQDWTPLLQKEGKSILNSYSKDDIFYAWDDKSEKLYRFPDDISEPGTMTTVIRKDWLDNLGLDVPKTYDEYLNVLRAFTKDDPDGNGKNDTYGLGGEYYWRAFAPFFYSHGVDVENWLKQDDGTLKFGAVMPQVKDVLKDLQELYKEGVINPKMTTEANAKVDEEYANGKVGSLYYWVASANPNYSPGQSFKAKNPKGEYLQIDPIIGPDGFASDVPSGTPWCYLSITQHDQHPDITMQLLNEMNTPDTMQLITFGEEGKDYNLKDGAADPLISPAEKDKKGIGTYWYMTRKDKANLDNTTAVNKLFAEREKTSQPMRDKIVYIKALDRPAWDDYSGDLNKLRDQTFWAIITGKKPVSAFDDFVKQWYKMGGDKVEKETNDLYKDQQKQRDKFDDWYKKNIEPYK